MPNESLNGLDAQPQDTTPAETVPGGEFPPTPATPPALPEVSGTQPKKKGKYTWHKGQHRKCVRCRRYVAKKAEARKERQETAKEKLPGVIDLTPSWSGVLPILLELHLQPGEREYVRSELRKMAKAADAYNESLKASK